MGPHPQAMRLLGSLVTLPGNKERNSTREAPRRGLPLLGVFSFHKENTKDANGGGAGKQGLLGKSVNRS